MQTAQRWHLAFLFILIYFADEIANNVNEYVQAFFFSKVRI